MAEGMRGGYSRPLALRSHAAIFGRRNVGEVAERERSVRAAPPIGSEEPLFLTVPLRPTPEGPKHAVQPLLRTVVATVWVDRRGDLEEVYLPPGAIREIVKSSSKRGRTLAVCAGDLLLLLRPLRCRPLLVPPRLPVPALQRWLLLRFCRNRSALVPLFQGSPRLNRDIEVRTKPALQLAGSAYTSQYATLRVRWSVQFELYR